MRYVFLVLLTLFIIGPLWLLVTRQASFSGDWRTANRDSAKMAPDPSIFQEAIIQVYAARAFNWRGLFSVHCWIATKQKHAKHYQVFQVIGWRRLRGLSVVSMEDDVPDRRWFNSYPILLADIRGRLAEQLIPEIAIAAQQYPYGNVYKIWPGPNSNTFVAFIARRVPKLRLVIPGNAVGRDYLGAGPRIAKTPSGTGWQLSVSGLLGIMIALREGIEINLIGLVIGIGPADLSITLPAIGRLALLQQVTQKE